MHFYTLRSAVTNRKCSLWQYSVNVCSLFIGFIKGVWQMNHHSLFIKLMERRIPNNILSILERWFAVSVTCVKWCNKFSAFFNLSCGVRQGGVLSPLYVCFIDSVVNNVKSSGVGCSVNIWIYCCMLITSFWWPPISNLSPAYLEYMRSRIGMTWYACQSKEILTYSLWCPF